MEVMIVLAIAGLVLAIVFIAVPALQRNSRNTQRRSDLANLRAQFDTWTSNNNGKLPTTADHMLSITGSTGWGHYNGNDDEPGFTLITADPGTGTASAACNASTTPACTNNDTRPAGKAGGTAAGEYVITYADDKDPTTAVVLPNRQEIHIWGQMACDTDGILAAGNDADNAVTAGKYAAGDILPSNARAVAFVYQIEGEDNARCEDNV